MNRNTTMKTIQITLLLIGLFILITDAHPDVIRTEVKYVASDAVYIDAGRADGLQVNDMVIIQRDGLAIDSLTISFLAEHSSSCSISSPDHSIIVGDIAIVVVETVDEVVMSVEEESAAEVQDEEYTESNAEITSQQYRYSSSGFASIRYMIQDNLGNLNHDYHQPSLYFRYRAENIWSSPISFSIRTRARNTRRTDSYSDAGYTSWNNRIYELSLQYDSPVNPYYAEMGRVQSNRISGLGMFDGILGEYSVSTNTGIGIFTGTLPELSNSKPQLNEVLAGIYIKSDREINTDTRISGTLAAIGKYKEGEIDEEYLYEQMHIRLNRKLSLHQSAEMSINRGWRKEREETRFRLSNLYVNLRYVPTSGINIQLSFDTRRLMRTYENRNTPDSLFNNNHHSGLRGSVWFRLPYRIAIRVNGGILATQHENNPAKTYSFSIQQNDIAGTNINADISTNNYENQLVNGNQLAFRMYRNWSRIFNTSLSIGQNNYRYNNTSNSLINRWMRAGIDSNLTDNMYISFDFEVYRGASYNSNIYSIDVGYRL